MPYLKVQQSQKAINDSLVIKFNGGRHQAKRLLIVNSDKLLFNISFVLTL
jgi:hypothetical protein